LNPAADDVSLRRYKPVVLPAWVMPAGLHHGTTLP
jgi:hypothetical protein